MSHFTIKKTVTTRFELRVVAVSQAEEFDDGKGNAESLVPDEGRVATVSDIISALKADETARDMVLRAFAPIPLLGNDAATVAALRQQSSVDYAAMQAEAHQQRNWGKG